MPAFLLPLLSKFAPYIIIAVMALGGFAYIKYQNAKLDAAEANNIRLEELAKAQDVALKQKDADIQKMRELNIEISKKWAVANQETIDLKKKLTQTKTGESRDLSKLIVREPKIMEDKINRGTRFALRCNEIVSGSKVTELDKDNTICPSLIMKELKK